MRKYFLFFVFLFAISTTKSQTTFTLKDTSWFYFNNFQQLADKDYTFQQILTDSSLPFKQDSSFVAKGLTHFWIKLTINNPSIYDKNYMMLVPPMMQHTMYYFDEEKKEWLTKQGGYYSSKHSTRTNRFVKHSFKSKASTTLYFKVNVKEFTPYSFKINTFIVFRDSVSIEKQMAQRYLLWAITISILLVFFVYNLYLYFMFKDRSYLYYLLIIVGGIIYITTDNEYFSYFTGLKFISLDMPRDGYFVVYDVDVLLGIFSTLLIHTGFLQFARTYLNTKELLPKLDKILKFINVFAVIVLAGIGLSYLGVGMKYTYMLSISQNVIHCIVFIALLGVGFASLRNNKKQAKYYLIAQGIPVIVMFVLVILLFVNNFQLIGIPYLPNTAIILQTLLFALALVARVNLLKDDLHQKEIISKEVTSKLAFEKEQNIRLKQQGEHDKKEIASAQQIRLLMKELHHRVKNNLQIVSSLLSLQSFRIKDKMASDAVKEGQLRIEAMSLIHQRLYTTDNITEVNIKEYITDLSESLMQAYGFAKNEFDLELQVSNELMNVDKAIPLSLIINELITNAFKYAFTKDSLPKLYVELKRKEGAMMLTIKDNGKGIDIDAWTTQKGNSFGKELIQTFTKQLNGNIYINAESGTTFKISFPL